MHIVTKPPTQNVCEISKRQYLLFDCLQEKLKRVLNRLLQLAHPFSTDGAVDNLVVEAGGNGDLVIPLNVRGAVLVLDGNGDLLGGTDSENGSLRRVDDGGEVVDGLVHAHVGDGDCAALELFRLELVVASLLGKLLDLARDGLQAAGIDASNDRGDQTGRSGNGNGHVHAVELADDAVAPARVDGRDLLAGGCDSLDEEVVDGELVLALRRAVQRLSKLEQLGHGQGASDEEVGVVLHRFLEAVGNDLAHAADGNILVGGTWSGHSRAADSLLDILLGDLATLAGALEAVQADTALASKTLGSRGSIGLSVESSL